MQTRSNVFKSAGRTAALPSGPDDLQFMAVSWNAGDELPGPVSSSSEEEDGEGDTERRRPYVPRSFTVRVFGVTSVGASVCLTLTGFTPFFFVRVEDAWGTLGGSRLRGWLAQAKGPGWRVVDAQLLRRKDYLGFHNGARSTFVKVSFSQQFAMRQLSKRLIAGLSAEGACLDLTPIGVPHRGTLRVYESNIDPVLRLMHLRAVSPAGWVRVRSGKWYDMSARRTSSCQLDAECAWSELHAMQDTDSTDSTDSIAPILVFSLDIECGSSHGDFPQAKKGFNKLGMELAQAYTHSGLRSFPAEEQATAMTACLRKAFGMEHAPLPVCDAVSRVFPKFEVQAETLPGLARLILAETRLPHSGRGSRTAIERVTEVLDGFCPVHPVHSAAGAWGAATPQPPGLLHGDPVIQIGVTMHVYGDRTCCQRHILTLGTCDLISGTCVHEYVDEASLLTGFSDLVRCSDPDVVIGYNQFGFDFAYLNGRAEELGVKEASSVLGRLVGVPCTFKEQTLSSSALGDNVLRYYDITGRCQIDLMKLVQREHKLDSYKLDAVAEHFIGMRKNDISPNDIFRLQLGTSSDRRVIAEYCVQDCELCNHLLMKLEVVANNVGMANVCSVPLAFIFLRGQGIKVLSLVAKRCLAEGFLIPTPAPWSDGNTGKDVEEEGYEGAIVLEPETGLYLKEPVSVLDFASLYPSSMISGNLSHDTIVLDACYDNLPGVRYDDVRYDVRDGKGVRVREEVCRYAQSTTGILPMILKDLLSARKSTRARIKRRKAEGADAFELAVLDGLQLAFKVTANSMYGGTGARTSALYLKQIAACTTAIGRAMILKAKAFLEEEHGARVIYGDTDSVFAVFPNKGLLEGKMVLQASIDEGVRASCAFRAHLPPPHDLEYEKTYFPFFLLSKKRYVGKKFKLSAEADGQVSSMGLVINRRDNAPIVKTIYGGIIDILLHRQDVHEAERFLQQRLLQLVNGEVEMEQLVVSKALKGFYKAPDTIAHYVLARRMGERDPGSRPQVNERVPYVYVVAPLKWLQGERIEDPAFVRASGIQVDTTHYVTNQIMKPVLQLMSLAMESLTGYSADRSISRGLKEVVAAGGNVAAYREAAVRRLLFDTVLCSKQVKELEKKRQRIGSKFENERVGQLELTDFFRVYPKKRL